MGYLGMKLSFEDTKIRTMFGPQNGDISRLFRMLDNGEVRNFYEACRLVRGTK
jgi:hypothetical protein